MNKTPKGTIDLYEDSYERLSLYKNSLETVFKSYGGIGLDTPVFEIKENLMGKYGEEAENKLVFNLEDCKTEKGEKYTLRYDLTVPKLRFIKSRNIGKERIYSIGKVYRRDNPSVGRYREFYQADFDIIGEDAESMVNEFLLLKMAADFLKENSVDDFTILVNDTRYLQYLLVEKIGISLSSFKSVCSTIDKLDKCGFEEIVPELKKKGLVSEQVEKLKECLKTDQPLLEETAKNLDQLVSYAGMFDFGNKIKFTPSLARGLDYYNGVIYEIKLGSGSSIISGGRYDMNGKSMIGISFGLSRIVDLISPLVKEDEWKDVYYLTTVPEDGISVTDKLSFVKKCETLFKRKIMFGADRKDKKLIKTISFCISNRFRYVIIVGSTELNENCVIVKDLRENTQKCVKM